MNRNNPLTHLLKIKYPLIQAPMLGCTTPQMVASAADNGIMGSLPLGLLTKEKAQDLIRATKKLTNVPFSVNVFVYSTPRATKDSPLNFLRSYYEKNNLPFPGAPQENPYPLYEELIDVIIGEKIPVVSFTFGLPVRQIVDQLKANGIVLIGIATCAEEAKKAQDSGMDVVVAQGIEAGGHRGTFIDGELPQVGLMALLPQVIDSVRIPVVAAGGLSQGKSIAAAFILGAQGAQVGSAFLRSKESALSMVHKDLIHSSTDSSTIISNAWTGRYARMIPNALTRQSPENELLPYLYQNYLTTLLRQAGKERNDPDLLTLYAGQSAKYARDASTADIVQHLIAETEEVLVNSTEIFNKSAS